MKSIFISIDRAIPCGLILNELATNVIKHAYPERTQGKLRLTLDYDSDGSIRMVVSDNGVGLPENFQFETAESLGLKIIHTLVRQIDGAIEIKLEEGTEFIITFTDTD